MSVSEFMTQLAAGGTAGSGGVAAGAGTSEAAEPYDDGGELGGSVEGGLPGV